MNLRGLELMSPMSVERFVWYISIMYFNFIVVGKSRE